MIPIDIRKQNQINYFGASVFIHLSLLLYFIFGIPQNSKTSLLPLGVEIVMESAQKVASSVQSSKFTKSKNNTDAESPTMTVVAKQPDAVTEKSQLSVMQTSTAGSADSGLSASGQEGVQNGQNVSAEERFVYEVKKWFDRKKVYPQMAKAMGISGTVVVEFTMNSAGEILKAQVKKGSHPSLDQSALKLIQSIHGQKPFPSEIKKTTWTMSVPIEFSLR